MISGSSGTTVGFPVALPVLKPSLTGSELRIYASSPWLDGIIEAKRGPQAGAAENQFLIGQNLPISPEQIRQALGKGQVKQIAKDAGMSRGAAADALS